MSNRKSMNAAMKFEFPKNLAVVGVLSLIFVSIPFLPTSVTMWSDNSFVRAFLLVIFVLALLVNPLYGLLVLMIIGLLFIGRNKTKIDILRHDAAIADENSEAVQGIVSPETAPPMPPYEDAETTTYEYKPLEDESSNEFKQVGVSIDGKVAPEAAISNSSSRAISQLFGEIKPLED